MRRETSDAFTVVLHWTLVITLLASLATGLRISADRIDSGWAGMLQSILPQGDVFRWHVWGGYALGLVACAYVVFLMTARIKRRVRIPRVPPDTPAVARRKRRLRQANVLVYWLGFLLLLSAIVTGVVHYLMPRFIPQEKLLLVHRATAWTFVLYVFLHVGLQFAHGGLPRLLKILRPTRRYGLASLIAAAAATVGGVAVYAIERHTLPELVVERVESVPRVDGVTQDAVWSEAEAVSVHTVRGANHEAGETTIEVKAVHDGEHLYAQFRWPDDTRSQKHLPLLKTAAGWKVMQSRYGKQDEVHYYEDKFAVMWDTEAVNAAAATVHMGAKPLDNKPGPSGGRGLHYSTDGDVVDVWHWKSVRTGSDATQQIDDNYFGPPLDVDPEKSRYTGGYTQDPDTGGGYDMNWEDFSDDIVQPKRLPKNSATLSARVRDVDLDTEVSDDGEFFLKMSETIPYSKSADRFPVGTVLPSVLLKGPRSGDRGDVKAVSTWQDGWWNMEVKRKLDTGSRYDVAFEPGSTRFMWLAAFDHAQTRHSYHIRPVEVLVQ